MPMSYGAAACDYAQEVLLAVIVFPLLFIAVSLAPLAWNLTKFAFPRTTLSFFSKNYFLVVFAYLNALICPVPLFSSSSSSSSPCPICLEAALRNMFPPSGRVPVPVPSAYGGGMRPAPVDDEPVAKRQMASGPMPPPYAQVHAMPSYAVPPSKRNSEVL